MKKRNEDGYVLVYVMVVVFVLCAIATTLITQTIHTMAAQKNMVERMQDKYVAMGEIERVVAELEVACIGYSKDGFISQFDAEDNVLPNLVTHINTFSVPADSHCSLVIQDSDKYVFSENISDPENPDASIVAHYVEVKTISSDTDASILAKLRIDNFNYNVSDYEVNNPNYNPNATAAEKVANQDWNKEKLQRYKFTISDMTICFESYVISIGGDS